MPEVKKFLLNCFLEAYDSKGQVDRSKIVSKRNAFLRLEIEIEKNGWGVEAKRTEPQIGAHIDEKSRKALKQQTVDTDFGIFLNDSGSDEEA